MVELHETSEIMKQASAKSLVILDELGRGTSTMDGVAIADAVLEHFVNDVGCLMLFVTHYPSLSSYAIKYPGIVQNFYMSFLEQKSADGSVGITFLHKLTEGTAHRSYGLNVARLANLPEKVLQLAKNKAADLERIMVHRKFAKIARVICSLLKGDLPQSVDVLLLRPEFECL